MAETDTRVVHPFAPVWDGNSRTLVLGTFPSVQSRRNAFYYGHPQNRFWQVLAALVRTHRRGIAKNTFDDIPDRLLQRTKQVAALLRLAVLLNRSHGAVDLPTLKLRADGPQLTLTLPKRWLDSRPLMRTDLSGEQDDLPALGFSLRITD